MFANIKYIMNIVEKYRFGKIVVSGKSYSSDLIIFKDFIKEKWWRKEGHKLHLDDLEILNEKEIEVLVVGTGSIGKMEVPEDVIKELEQKDIVVYAYKSAEATEKYNKFAEEGRNTALAIHLTC